MRTLVFKFLFISLLIAGQVEAQVPTRLVLEKTSADETLESMLSEHGLHVRRIMPPFVQQNGRRYMLASSRGAVPPLKSLTLRGRAYSEEDIRTLNNLVRSGGVSELDLREAESDSWDSLCFCGFADDDTVSLQIPLRRIALPRAMKRIPPYFAANLTELGEIIWPASLEEIQDAAFYRDTTLTIAHIPEGVSKIGVGAFAFCLHLKELTFPSTLQTVGRWSFLGCPEIKELRIPHDIQFDPYTFYVGSTPSMVGKFDNLFLTKRGLFDHDGSNTDGEAYPFTKTGFRIMTPGKWMTHIDKVVIPQDFVPFQRETHYQWIYEEYWYYIEVILKEVYHTWNEEWGWANSWAGYIDYGAFIKNVSWPQSSAKLYANIYGYSLPRDTSETSLLRRKDLCNRIGMLFYNADTVEIDPGNPHFKEVDGVLYDSTGTFILRYSPLRKERTFQIPDGTVLTFPCFPVLCNLDTLIFPQDGNIGITHGSPVGISPIMGRVDDYKGEKEDSTRNVYKMHKLKAMIFPSATTEVSEMAVSFFQVEKVIFYTSKMPKKTAPAVAWRMQHYDGPNGDDGPCNFLEYLPYDPGVPTLHLWEKVYADFSDMGTWTAEYSGQIHPLSNLENNIPKTTIWQPFVKGGDGFLTVSRAAGKQVDVYSVSGTLVASRRMAAPSEKIYLKGKSVYIVRIGDQYNLKVLVR